MIEIVATYQAKVIVSYYPYFRKIMGHDASIFFPLADPSLYKGSDDNASAYNDFPDIQDKFVMFNVVDYNIGGNAPFFDNFIQNEPHMMVSSDINIPNGSKVVIDTAYGRKEYTTDLVLGYKGAKDTIIYKIKLNPRSF